MREAGHLDIPAERIRDEVDRVAESQERPDAMELREGRAPGLEERLRRDHQNVHAGEPDRAGGLTKSTCYTTPPSLVATGRC